MYNVVKVIVLLKEDIIVLCFVKKMRQKHRFFYIIIWNILRIIHYLIILNVIILQIPKMMMKMKI